MDNPEDLAAKLYAKKFADHWTFETWQTSELQDQVIDYFLEHVYTDSSAQSACLVSEDAYRAVRREIRIGRTIRFLFLLAATLIVVGLILLAIAVKL